MSASADPEKAAAPVAAEGGEVDKAVAKAEEAGSGGTNSDAMNPKLAGAVQGEDIRPVATGINKYTHYKNRLQEWTQRNNLKLPVYLTEAEGDPHLLKFRSTVEVDGKPFPSDQCHSRLKDAEQDAAKVAYEFLVTKDDDPVAAEGGEVEKAEAKPEKAGSGGELPYCGGTNSDAMNPKLAGEVQGEDIRSVATGSNKYTNYKNRLQEWTQRNNLKLPVYLTVSEGDPHPPKFRSTVEVDGKPFPSDRCHSRLKDAEQDAAKVACEFLVTIDDDPTDVLMLIDQGVMYCKSILNEFAVKTKVTQPTTYSVGCPEGVAPMTLFVSSVSFAGKTYTGEAGTNKKVAEQKAARAAIQSILATNNNCMKEIIRSKKQQIVAITSFGFNKERVVSQENCNAPTNAITSVAPIKFVPAVGAACPTSDQGGNIIPAAGPSAQAISSSKKRKNRITAGQNVIHRNVRAA